MDDLPVENRSLFFLLFECMEKMKEERGVMCDFYCWG